MKNKKNMIHEQIRGSLFLLALRLVVAMLLVDAVYAGLFYLLNLEFSLPFDWHHHISVGLLLFQIIKIIIQVYFILFIVLEWVNNVYYLTESDLVERKGILSVKEKIYDFEKIRSISVNQSLSGRLFNYGDIIITTSASGGYQKDIYLSGINSPRKYEDILRSCI